MCVEAPFPGCLQRSKVICPGLNAWLRNRGGIDTGGTNLWWMWLRLRSCSRDDDTNDWENKCIHEKFIFRIKCSLLTMTWLVILNRNNNTNNHNCYLQGRLYTMRNFHNLCSISTYNWGVANFIMFINDDLPIAGDRFNHICWDYKIHKTIQQLKWGDLKGEEISTKIVQFYSHFW